MIIKFYELKKVLDKKVNFFLLYGKNVGLIDECISDAFKPNANEKVLRYDENDVLSNFEVFKEEVFNKSFFDNNKLIIVNRVSDKILRIIEEIIDKNIDDLRIILKTGILEKKSKLRGFFEKNPKTIIIPFYEDNNQTLLFIANNFFKEKKIKISNQNINLIVERSKGDRINLRNELEKIAIFSKNKLSVKTDEILKLTNLAENYNISELVDQCLLKNKKKTLHILNENNPSIEDNIIILKTFLFKLKRLKRLKIEIEANKSTDEVLSSYKPSIFWKDKDLIKQQLKIWSLDQLKNLTKSTNDLEILIKKNSQISNLITNNFILEKLELSNN
jgi:DNA polymerase III subunit delta